ncbi:MAG TPA: CDGSH iron-sulfur domain-containing protein [Methylomirabilota bacterium]|jgi:CDGSH-type Zn-finger protein|nr:CDGSH iron-sulfur domain-containing protein [Methylomirabilota bacterium]
MSITVKPIPDGPLMVKGECEVLDAQGNSLPAKTGDTFLCRCGASGNKPFCDGGHKRIGFKSEREGAPSGVTRLTRCDS